MAYVEVFYLLTDYSTMLPTQDYAASNFRMLIKEGFGKDVEGRSLYVLI
jgi:hypothetical protein